MSVSDVTCSIDGIKVSMPEGKRIKPGGKVKVAVETPESGLPRGPIRGEVRVATNIPDHAVIAIPVDGTALK